MAKTMAGDPSFKVLVAVGQPERDAILICLRAVQDGIAEDSTADKFEKLPQLKREGLPPSLFL
jgi:hypothetical protein